MVSVKQHNMILTKKYHLRCHKGSHESSVKWTTTQNTHATEFQENSDTSKTENCPYIYISTKQVYPGNQAVFCPNYGPGVAAYWRTISHVWIATWLMCVPIAISVHTIRTIVLAVQQGRPILNRRICDKTQHLLLAFLNSLPKWNERCHISCYNKNNISLIWIQLRFYSLIPHL